MFRIMAKKHEKARYYLLQIVLLMALMLLFALPGINGSSSTRTKVGISQHGEISISNEFHPVSSRF